MKINPQIVIDQYTAYAQPKRRPSGSICFKNRDCPQKNQIIIIIIREK